VAASLNKRFEIILWDDGHIRPVADVAAAARKDD
jgi:hypothetical protein